MYPTPCSPENQFQKVFIPSKPNRMRSNDKYYFTWSGHGFIAESTNALWMQLACSCYTKALHIRNDPNAMVYGDLCCQQRKCHLLGKYCSTNCIRSMHQEIVKDALEILAEWLEPTIRRLSPSFYSTSTRIEVLHQLWFDLNWQCSRVY